MAHDAVRLSFKIDAFQPETIPMARLAEYMADLATMIGEKADVHFVRVEEGCAQVIHDVAFTAYPKVDERTRAVRNGTAPVEAMNAYRALNKKLAYDNTFATYGVFEGEAQVLEFPGVREPKPVEITPIEQPGSIVGIVQGIGGRTVTEKGIPVFIDAGDTVHTCSAPRGVARELGHFILGDPRRFEGVANWQREESGAWTLKKFTIKTHEPVDGASLSETVEQLRAVPSGLSELRDPWGELMKQRRDEGEPN